MPDSTLNVYIERANFYREDDEAVAEYSVGNPANSKFQFHFHNGQLWVENTNLVTRNASLNSSFPIGPVDARGLPSSWYVLSGTEDKFNSVGNVEGWMSMNISDLKDKTLRQLCMPASHDSAMFTITEKTKLAAWGSILTQVLNIHDQLTVGIRWFDIRPVRSTDNQWYVGHWTDTNSPINWEGGNGPLLKDVVSQVNDFCNNHQELIILALSPDNTFVATGNYDDLHPAPDEYWEEILQLLCDDKNGLQHRWSATKRFTETGDLTKVPMGDFIVDTSTPTKAAVVIIVKDGIDVSQFNGCFNQKAWPWVSSPWDHSRESNRLSDWLSAAVDPLNPPYSYSLCHTQSDGEAAVTTTEEVLSLVPQVSLPQPLGWTEDSVLYNAADKARNFFYELYPNTTSGRFPAALAVNGIDYSQYAALAMAFNQRSSK